MSLTKRASVLIDESESMRVIARRNLDQARERDACEEKEDFLTNAFGRAFMTMKITSDCDGLVSFVISATRLVLL